MLWMSHLSQPVPTGAQAVAWRVERYDKENHACLMDLYLDDTIPIRFPESESSYFQPIQVLDIN